MNCAAMAAIDVLIVNKLAGIKLMNLAVISICKPTNGVISTKEVVICLYWTCLVHSSYWCIIYSVVVF